MKILSAPDRQFLSATENTVCIYAANMLFSVLAHKRMSGSDHQHLLLNKGMVQVLTMESHHIENEVMKSENAGSQKSVGF